MAVWDRQNVLKFIDAYRREDCLWNVKSEDYNNRWMKEDAYSRLIACVVPFDSTANRDTLVKKINNIRSVFRKELKKIKQSRASGCSEEKVYRPRLWYFKHLEFLLNQYGEGDNNNSGDSGSEQENVDEVPLKFEIDTSSRESAVPTFNYDAVPKRTFEALPTPAPTPTYDPVFSKISRRRSKRSVMQTYSDDDEDDVVDLLNHDRSRSKKERRDLDDADIFTSNVAAKLRNMDKIQRIYTEKVINEALFYGELGQMSQNSHVTVVPAESLD